MIVVFPDHTYYFCSARKALIRNAKESTFLVRGLQDSSRDITVLDPSVRLLLEYSSIVLVSPVQRDVCRCACNELQSSSRQKILFDS